MTDVINPGLLSGLLDVLSKIDAKNKIVVLVHNRTDVPLVFAGYEEMSGSFATQASPEILAGESDAFGWVERSGSVLTGAEGKVTYDIGGEGHTFWTIHFDNPTAGRNTAEGTVSGRDAALYTELAVPGAGDQTEMSFTLRKPGTAPPRPGGGGAAGVTASCIVTVTNQTALPLQLIDQGHEYGGFVTFPPAVVDPRESVSFGSAETPGSGKGGTKGYLTYAIGDDSASWVQLQWDNPENAQNTTAVQVGGPQSGDLRVLDQIGQGEENVPVAFTVSGGAPGGGGVDPPKEQPDYVPPIEQSQPTLRQGDQSMDGWVEYLQELLNHWRRSDGLGLIAVDGDFGPGTYNAVIAFQRDRGLQVDGTVGNQTWAALREEPPQAPSTDGRTPHTFVEVGLEARWFTESEGFVVWSMQQLSARAWNTGSDPIPPGTVTATVRLNGTHVIAVPNGNGAVPGESFEFDLSELLPLLVPGENLLEAYLPQELGGDQIRTPMLYAP
jgi:peptidoglycan hydrolase-like protein with peptidoglycan-binding domain